MDEKNYPKIKNIILDLDNTVISSVEMDKLKKMSKKEKDRLKEFNYDDMGRLFRVFHRPGVQEFLSFIFSKYNVSVWTAASKDYALFIIDHILLNKKYPNRKLDFIFFDYHVDISEIKKDHPKYLDLLWNYFKFTGYNKDNTVIIDDNKDVHLGQKNNVIKALYFDVEKASTSTDDTFLYNLVDKLASCHSTTCS